MAEAFAALTADDAAALTEPDGAPAAAVADDAVVEPAPAPPEPAAALVLPQVGLRHFLQLESLPAELSMPFQVWAKNRQFAPKMTIPEWRGRLAAFKKHPL